ncbi:MAG: biotin transporter BioY [Synechococcaceae cyanobacterium SM2_3_2]|nr:biotin transporter BioY [Synechococcaceae cyanobacterium SM2_3_2]
MERVYVGPFVPLMQALMPRRTLLRDVMLILGGSWFVAAMAQVAIPLPFTPVPITGQTLGVVLVGATLGSRLGGISLLTYLAQALVGLPFFSRGGSGWSHLTGATGGYLVAFLLAAVLMGWLVERWGCDRNPLKMAGAMLLTSALTLSLGSLWLGIWLGMAGNFVGVGDVLMLGMIPFIPGDLVKNLLASSLLPLSWRVINRPVSRSEQPRGHQN